MVKPTFPYFNAATPFGILATWVFKIVMEGLTSSVWISNLPWNFIYILLGGFFLGQTASDLLHRNSQLRRWWDYKTRSFDMLTVGRNRTDISNNECVEIFCVLKFVRNLSSPLLTVKVIQLLPNDKIQNTVVHQERLGEVVKDQNLRLRLGTVSKTLPGAKAAFHSIWGSEVPTAELKHGQLSIVGGNKEIIEISVERKSHKIYAEPLMNLDYRVLLISEGDRIWSMLS